MQLPDIIDHTVIDSDKDQWRQWNDQYLLFEHIQTSAIYAPILAIVNDIPKQLTIDEVYNIIQAQAIQNGCKWEYIGIANQDIDIQTLSDQNVKFTKRSKLGYSYNTIYNLVIRLAFGSKNHNYDKGLDLYLTSVFSTFGYIPTVEIINRIIQKYRNE